MASDKYIRWQGYAIAQLRSLTLQPAQESPHEQPLISDGANR
jgi:hypothetical protein